MKTKFYLSLLLLSFLSIGQMWGMTGDVTLVISYADFPDGYTQTTGTKGTFYKTAKTSNDVTIGYSGVNTKSSATAADHAYGYAMFLKNYGVAYSTTCPSGYYVSSVTVTFGSNTGTSGKVGIAISSSSSSTRDSSVSESVTKGGTCSATNSDQSKKYWNFSTTGANVQVDKITIIYSLTASEKTDVSLNWQKGGNPVTTFTATIGESNSFPTLNVTPSVSGVTYESSAIGIATINETTGAINLESPGTTTITAKFAGDDTHNAATPASYTLTVEAGGSVPEFTTIPALYEHFKVNITQHTVKVTFNNWTIVGIRQAHTDYNESAFITDGENGFILMGSGYVASGFAVGDKLSGVVTCPAEWFASASTIDMYNVTPSSVSRSTGEAITPMVIDESTHALSTLSGVNTGRVIRLEGWTYTSSPKKTFTKGVQSIEYYDWLGSSDVTEKLLDNHVYNITGIYREYWSGGNCTQEIMFNSGTIPEDVTPMLEVNQATLDFETVECNTTKNLNTITVSGAHLTNNITLSIGGTDASYFSIVSPSSPISKGTGTVAETSITIQYAPKAVGSHTATLTISSEGALNTPQTVNLSGTCEQHRSVTWMVNGYNWNEGHGNPTTEVLDGGKITNMPDDPTKSECDDSKVFVGWTTSPIEEETDTKPTKLFKEVGDFEAISGSDAIYYAVFADETGGGGESSTNTITYDTENIPTGYGAAADVVLNGATFNVTQMYKNGQKMQWRAAGNSNGTGTMYNKTEFPCLQSIAITYTKEDTKKNFTVKVGDSENPTDGTEITAAQVDETSTYIYDCSSESKSYFVLTNGENAGYLSTIVITYGGGTSYSGYVTECKPCDDITVAFSPATTTILRTKTYNAAETLTRELHEATVTYSSANPAIATVEPATGVVTAVAAGSTTITASIAKVKTSTDKDWCAGEAELTVTVEELPNLGAPTGLTVSNITLNGATLSWNSVSNATSYVVTVGGNAYPATSSTSLTIEDLSPGTEYTWSVTAQADDYNPATANGTSFTTLRGFTVTYHRNGATSGNLPVLGGKINVTEGETHEIWDNTGNLAKSGYEFAGWHNSQEYSETPCYTIGAGVVITENITIYANWRPKRDTFEDRMHGKAVQYGDGAYTVPSLTDTDVPAADETDCTPLHYHFVGWILESKVATLTDESVLVQAGASQNATGATYIAVWAQKLDD